MSDIPAQFPDEDLPGHGSRIPAKDYPSALEPEAIDPDFPSSPGAPAEPDPDPTPDEPSPAPPAEPTIPVDDAVPVEPQPYDDTNPDPPTESFFGRSIN